MKARVDVLDEARELGKVNLSTDPKYMFSKKGSLRYTARNRGDEMSQKMDALRVYRENVFISTTSLTDTVI